MLIVVLVVVLLAGGGFGATMLLGNDDDGPAASRTSTSDSSELDQDDPSETSSPSASAAVEAEPSETPDPTPLINCWDGSAADRVNQCSQPTGRAGLEWVFPSLARADCHNNAAGIDTDRSQLWDCTDYLRDGTAIEIHYSQWNQLPAAIDHYDTRAYDKTLLPNGLVRWFIISTDNLYKAALMYRDAPWSVTVYSPTAAGRDRALETLVELRPRDELRGSR